MIDFLPAHILLKNKYSDFENIIERILKQIKSENYLDKNGVDISEFELYYALSKCILLFFEANLCPATIIVENNKTKVYLEDRYKLATGHNYYSSRELTFLEKIKP